MAITDKNKPTLERLKELKSLYDAGILTKEEMEAEKAEILGRAGSAASSSPDAKNDSEETSTGTFGKEEHAISGKRSKKTVVLIVAAVLILVAIFLILFMKQRSISEIDMNRNAVTSADTDTAYNCYSGEVFVEEVDTDVADKTSDQESEKFVYYYNVRFGYRIAYPSHFTQMPEPENSDGCEIRRDEQTYILVYGGYNALEETIEDMYNKSKAEGQITYSRLKNNWFVISGYTENGHIFYQKTVLRGDVIFTAILYYTEDENTYFSQIIPKIFSDFPD